MRTAAALILSSFFVFGATYIIGKHGRDMVVTTTEAFLELTE